MPAERLSIINDFYLLIILFFNDIFFPKLSYKQIVKLDEELFSTLTIADPKNGLGEHDIKKEE